MYSYYLIILLSPLNKTHKNNHQKKQTQKKITNPEVKATIKVLPSGGQQWYSYFTENPVMTDDSNKGDFKSLFAKALGPEKFITMDEVQNSGKKISGYFRAGR
ncbi:hypothetical protein [Chryseobacterium viscerum]|uniref:Uncharacterized protein n=1 Tax=Chryseobacterium viscerum TaxID=1037377 RepID=A0A316WFC4_9FLAO|nr:hypothetical protein [Chryseobacterium viscerum]PWN59809.1 hypothetical protein C1634_017450 [Chryseobacterium viscerum]